MAAAARAQEEADDRDSLAVTIDDAKEAAIAIRGMRDTTTRELQRILADDVLGAVIVMAEDLFERDYDHDLRLQRVELALGLSPIDPDSDEEAEILAGTWSASEEESEGGDGGEESEVSPLAAQLANIPASVLQESFAALQKMVHIVATCSTPTEAEQEEAKQVEALIEFLLPSILPHEEEGQDEGEDESQGQESTETEEE